MASPSKLIEVKAGSICRVCLSCKLDTDLGLSLFEKYNDYLIVEQINELTNVSIEEGDGLPDRICPTCLLQLQSAYTFKKTCEKTNEILLTCNYVAKQCDGPLKNVKTECSDDDDNRDSFQPEFQDDSIEIDEKPIIHELTPGKSLKKLECHDCGDIFITKHKLLGHWKKVHSLKLDIACPRCSQKFKTMAAYKIHKKRRKACFAAVKYHVKGENGISEYQCKECKFSTKYRNKLKAHSVKHSIKPFISKALDLKLECHDCGGSFPSKCKLRVHWKKVHLPQLIFKCERCALTFKTYAALKKHRKSNSKLCVTASHYVIVGEGKNSTFQCKKCEFKTKNRAGLQVHINNHSDIKDYQCNLCDKGYTTKASLLRHNETRHKIYTAEGTCQFCGKFIQGKERMLTHLQRHKLKVGDFTCKICNNTLASKVGLQMHMKRHGSKSIICEICSKSFYTSGELCVHRKFHFKAKAKKYECNKCNYRTYWHTRITEHKKQHTDSNVSCDICGKFLENKVQLKIHRERHTNKSHKCPQCENTYYARDSLAKHLRKKHHTSIVDIET